MLKKLIVASSLVLGMFVISSFGQVTNTPGTPKNDPNQNQNRRQKGNGKGRGNKANNKFNQMDINHDGFISQSEWTRNEKAFNRIDTNNDGQLSKEEFEMARQEKGEKGNKTKPNPQY